MTRPGLILHGHSSHHPKGIEVFRGKLLLYGRGDLLNDYEGIGGYEAFRTDLTLMYFVTVEPSSGLLQRVTMLPMQRQCLRLHRAPTAEAH
jgi:poly-gamma-glutamate synthesis protein (capsule biosynthesis protein)